jgi:hypothetical protein
MAVSITATRSYRNENETVAWIQKFFKTIGGASKYFSRRGCWVWLYEHEENMNTPGGQKRSENTSILLILLFSMLPFTTTTQPLGMGMAGVTARAR